MAAGESVARSAAEEERGRFVKRAIATASLSIGSRAPEREREKHEGRPRWPTGGGDGSNGGGDGVYVCTRGPCFGAASGDLA